MNMTAALSTSRANDFFSDLQNRDLVHQTTDPEVGKFLKTPTVVYAGFDPTADSLHIGNLLPLMTLKRFQLAGHRPIAVVGGATGRVGDPSGKTQERKLMTDDFLKENLRGIRKDIEKILDFSGHSGALMVDNHDWFKDFLFLDFLRDVGKHFTVNHMMAKESVRARLEDREQGISYTEFSYMLLQAFDFYYLYKEKDCRVQIGGSDQWGNITAGCELIRRKGAEDTAYGITFPLITRSDGSKFGKTESGAIYMSEARTSVYDFYQYFIQVPDSDVMKLLKYFTFLSTEEMQALEESLRRSPEKREAQRALAREVTTLVHGAEKMRQAADAGQALFEMDFSKLDEAALLKVLKGAPVLEKSSLKELALLDVLVETGLCASKSAARRDIEGGGIYINQVKISDATRILSAADLVAKHYVVLRKGKKNYYLVRVKT